MPMLYHVMTPDAWAAARAAGRLEIANADEGFLHCAYRHQVDGVLQRWFAGHQELIALRIDPARLAAAVVDEDPYDVGEYFPHVYGPVPLDAVLEAIALRPGADGRLSLPPAR